MIGVGLIAVAVATLALSAAAWSACLMLRSGASFLLTTYLVVWVELVLASLALSAGNALSRTGLLVSLAIWLAASGACWLSRGRPRPPALTPRLAWLVSTLRTSELGVIAVVLAFGYAYLVALGLFTPQNDSDALAYHLSRAALWRQDAHIGVSGYTTDHRVDETPIVAEVGDAAALILAGNERFVWVFQLSAVGALSLGAFALARRVGLSARAALVGATVVPALPVIATQAVTGLNDLVLASFVIAAAVFVLGRERRELVPLVLSVALAVGTKFTAPFLLPIVAVVGAIGQPARRWPVLLATGAVGTVLGGGWYVVNLVRTGEPGGGAEVADRTVLGALEHLELLILSSVEVPGGDGWGAVVFLCTGLACALAVMSGVARRHLGNEWFVGGLVLAATPLAVVVTHKLIGSLIVLISEALEEDEFAGAVRAWRPSTVADGSVSWYGPFAAALGAALAIVCVRRVRKRTMTWVALALALAPWIAVAIIAVAIPWTPWHGRYLIAAWVMSVALWGAVTSERRWLAATVALVTSLTFVLSVSGYAGKPIGVPVLYSYDSRSIWRLERWEAQTVITSALGSAGRTGERLVIREVEWRVPPEATIAVTGSYDSMLFPYFGRDLRRTVLLVDDGEPLPSSAAWSVASPDSTPLGCPRAWRREFAHTSGWRLYERIRPDLCRRRQLMLSAVGRVG